jgi:hypothetical protein
VQSVINVEHQILESMANGMTITVFAVHVIRCKNAIFAMIAMKMAK